MARNTIPIALILGAASWFPQPSQGQQSDADAASLQQQLQRLGGVAETLDHSLPSLSCQEAAVSERVDRGKVKQHVAFTASMRAIRIPGGPLHESFTLTTVNGKAFSGKKTRFPFYTAGGFDAAMAYFMPAHQACYSFSLSDGRIDFETAPDAESHPRCRNDGVRGFALIGADGNVTHIERTVPAQVSRDFHLVPFAAIDFAPVDLNGKVFQLSHHLVSEYPEGDSKGRFEATYTDCRLFAVTVKIGPATEVEPGSAGAESVPPHP